MANPDQTILVVRCHGWRFRLVWAYLFAWVFCCRLVGQQGRPTPRLDKLVRWATDIEIEGAGPGELPAVEKSYKVKYTDAQE